MADKRIRTFYIIPGSRIARSCTNNKRSFRATFRIQAIILAALWRTSAPVNRLKNNNRLVESNDLTKKKLRVTTTIIFASIIVTWPSCETTFRNDGITVRCTRAVFHCTTEDGAYYVTLVPHETICRNHRRPK